MPILSEAECTEEGETIQVLQRMEHNLLLDMWQNWIGSKAIKLDTSDQATFTTQEEAIAAPEDMNRPKEEETVCKRNIIGILQNSNDKAVRSKGASNAAKSAFIGNTLPDGNFEAMMKKHQHMLETGITAKTTNVKIVPLVRDTSRTDHETARLLPSPGDDSPCNYLSRGKK